MRQSEKILSIVLPAAIVVLAIYVAVVNYIPGTWLTGWDNLHPEFNLTLNIKRSFTAVWQEYQGLGLLGGMAHAADLSRQLILLFLSAVLPANILRYAWTFLMLALGPVGVYFMVERLLFKEKSTRASFAAFAGGLFYLLNMATVQYFYTPYESFISFFGFLPWLLLVSGNYLKKGTVGAMALLVAVTILATSAFYVQTMFVVYITMLSLLILNSLLIYKSKAVKRIVVLFAVTLCVNAFWLLPAVYFSVTQNKVVTGSKINEIATPETRLMNEERGSFGDISLLRGFWIDYIDTNENGDYDFLMAGWRKHLDDKNIEYLGYVTFGTSVAGIVLAFVRRDLQYSLFAAFSFFLSYLMLATANPPFGFIYNELAGSLPLFEQIFRSAFTKWSIPMALTYSVGLAFFVYSVSSILKKTPGALLSFLLAAALSTGAFIIVKPVFSAKLIHPPIRANMPLEYSLLFNYLSDQPEERRVAYYPAQTFWGWNFYDWGYRGSGFLWYGIKQPILDRAFDVWSPYDEEFYTQFSTSIYANDEGLLQNTLDKYDVYYVLVDENIHIPGGDGSTLKFAETKELMRNLGAEIVFQEGKLSLYTFSNRSDSNGFLYSPNKLVRAQHGGGKVRIDSVYADNTDYVEVLDDTKLYPLSDIYQERLSDVSFENIGNRTNVTFSKNVPDGVYDIVVPALTSEQTYQIPATLTYDGLTLNIDFDSYLQVNGRDEQASVPSLQKKSLEITGNHDEIVVNINDKNTRIKKGQNIEESYSLIAGQETNILIFSASETTYYQLDRDFNEKDFNNCWEREGTQGFMNQVRSDNQMSLTVRDIVACTSYKIGDLKETSLMRVRMPYRSYFGSRPHFCLVIEGTYQCLNDEVFYNSAFSNVWDEVTRETVVPGGNVYWLEVLAKPSDSVGKLWTIEYKAPVVQSYPLIAQTYVLSSEWSSLMLPSTLTVASNGVLEFTIPSNATLIDVWGKGQYEIDNCDLFDRGEVEKSISNENGILYEAKNHGVVCDYTPLTSATTKGSYLVNLKGSNNKGRGLKFYVYNKATEKSEVENLLPHGDFDETYSLINWPKYDSSDYVLNIDLKSFGEVAESNLKSVTIYPVSLNLLADIVVYESLALDTKNDFSVTSPRVTRSAKKISTYYYKTEVDGGGNGILALSQGYDRGWNAYLGTPFISEKLEHVKVNGWSNGWIVPEGTHTVTIIYEPQLLQFAGFALLPMPLITSAVRFGWKKRK